MNPKAPYHTYADVPWYRRSSTNSVVLFIQLATLAFFPVSLWVCVVLLTGEVYYHKTDANGQLKRWSYGNKVAALVVFGACLAVLILQPFRRPR
jgi:hypothetical protein